MLDCPLCLRNNTALACKTWNEELALEGLEEMDFVNFSIKQGSILNLISITDILLYFRLVNITSFHLCEGCQGYNVPGKKRDLLIISI